MVHNLGNNSKTTTTAIKTGAAPIGNVDECLKTKYTNQKCKFLWKTGQQKQRKMLTSPNIRYRKILSKPPIEYVPFSARFLIKGVEELQINQKGIDE